ncbi:MAG: DUF1264 domain-containing protein [Gemmataceae bacterium]
MNRRDWLGATAAGLTGAGSAAAGSGSTPQADGHGGKPDAKFMAVMGGFHAHFCGIHVAKNNPKFQLVTQHYCALGKELHQCLLFDGCDAGAKLLGVEYIIPDELFRTLPDAEKKYWHPHTYEVMAGGLIAPGMSAEDEMKFMKAILPTWGKTWHTWPDPTTRVPMGDPLLMWSLGADDQVDPKVVAARDAQFKVETAKIRATRGKEFGLPVPQVPFPKTMDEIGRQWTAGGDDKPSK